MILIGFLISSVHEIGLETKMFQDPFETILDEIALEGLEGITLDTLWIRLNQLTNFPLKPTCEATQRYIFERIICPVCRNSDDIRLYSLPEPRPTLQLYNRYDHVNPETGFCVSNEEGIPPDIYAIIAPINEGGVKGSCPQFHQRLDVTDDVLTKCGALFDAVSKEYGSKLVVVASQYQRERALCITSIDPFVDLNATQFCILERVARSRFMGEITVGKEMANFKETAKTQYYLRKVLTAKGFIRKQVHTMYNSKTHLIFRGLLLMHTRFYIERRSPIEVAARRMSDLLTKCPNHECDYVTMKERMAIKPKLYRHLYQTYMKHFTVIEKEQPQNRRVKTRTVRLLKPFYGEDDDEQEVGDDAEEDETYGGLSGSSAIVGASNSVGITSFVSPDQIAQRARIYSADTIAINRTLLSQTYRIIEQHDSAQGISLRELQDCLKLPRLDVRMLIRMLERLQEVESVRIEVGRQKVSKYFLKHRQQKQFEQISSENVDLFPGEKVSLTFARRANLILRMVNEQRIIDQMNVLKRMLMDSETHLPYTIDQNSVHSIVRKLAKHGLVRWIKTKLVSHDRVTKINIVCVPSITGADPLIRERIEQAKFRYFGKVKEETNENNLAKSTDSNSKAPEEAKDASGRLGALPDTSSSLTIKQVRLIRQKSANVPKSADHHLILYQPAVGRKYGVEPKMKKLMTLYRFLHFLLNGGPEADEEYSDWRRFVTPLPEGREDGTCLIGDIVRRIPLSIFVKVVFITYIIPGLHELLQDPVRCNYTLHMISDEIRRLLLHRRKYIFSIIEVLTMLSYLNLVELRSEKISAKESVVVKLLKHVEFVDNDQLFSFEMNSLEDIDRFVSQLAFHASKGDCFNCSIDTRLSVHNPRNWSYTPKLKQHVKVDGKPNKRLQRLTTGITEPSLITTSAVPCSKTNEPLKPSESSKPNEPPKPSILITVINLDPVPQKANAPDNTPGNGNGKRRRAKTNQDKSGPAAKRVRHDYDAIDRKAMELMKKQRCDWSREEDSFLLMCRVASAMLDPTCPSFICVNRGVVRDELHRYLPHLSFDKTSKACQRRVMYMLKNPATKAHILDWVAECKQDIGLTSVKKPEQPKTHTQIWNETFLTLLHKLLRKFETNRSIDSGAISQSGWKLPRFRDRSEIEAEFKLVESHLQMLNTKSPLYQAPQNVLDIYSNSLMNILISTLMSNQLECATDQSDRFQTAHTLFKIYQRYPDTLIRSVVSQAQKHGVIAKTKNHLSPALLRSKGVIPYKISQHYQFVLRTRYCIDTLTVPLSSAVDFEIQDLFGSSETALTVACFAMQRAHFSLQIPDNFIILDESHPFYGTSGSNQALNLKLRPLDDAKNSSRFALYVLRQQSESHRRDKIQHVQDYLVLNKCSIRVRSLLDRQFDYAALHRELDRQQQFCGDPTDANDVEQIERTLLDKMEQHKEIGIDEHELIEWAQRELGFNEPQLRETLQRLLDANRVYRVGVTDFRLVNQSYALPWQIVSTSNQRPADGSSLTASSKITFLARFWKDPFGQVDRRVLFSYLSGVLAHVMAHPGVQQRKVIDHFSLCLPPTQTVELLDILEQIDCLKKVRLMIHQRIRLFDRDPPIEQFFYESTPQAFVSICHVRQLFEC